MKVKIHSLSFRIIARILIIILPLFVIILSVYCYCSRNIIRQETKKYSIQVAKTLECNIEKNLSSMEKVSQVVNMMMEQNLLPKDKVYPFMQEILQKNNMIYGLGISLEPSLMDKKYFAPYVCRCYDKNGKEAKNFKYTNIDYDYLNRDWYEIPKITGKPYWSEPYFGETGNVLMTTYSVPFYAYTNKNTKIFKGVVAIDVDLRLLTKKFSDIKILQSGYAFLLTRNGWMLTNPDTSKVMNESLFSLAEEEHYPLYREIGRDLMHGKSGFRELNVNDESKRWIYYTNLPRNGWSVAVVYPDSEMFVDMKQMNYILILLIFVGLVLLTVLTIQIVKQMATPITLFADSARKIAEGNFKVELPEVRNTDEILDLYDAFSQMQSQLSEYIINLKQTTAAKQSIESQLKIASLIQKGMIPKGYPVFPKYNEFNIDGLMKPAKEVGGDLYNFFMIDETHLCFVIGDVSDKSVPASLFMAMTNTLIKALALSGISPAEILAKANRELCRDNDQSMFVTLVLGVLDIKTGAVVYANAGHNPFLFGQPEKNETGYKKENSGIALGVFEEADYINESFTLNDNDFIFLYTDGITEAMNKNNEKFGEKRLLSFLSSSAHLPIQNMIDGVMDEIARFVDGNLQSDDIAILILRYNSNIDD